MTAVIDTAIQGLSLASVLLLSSLGFTVIYGVMGVVNLAHGELVMLGAYTSILYATILPAAPAIIGAALTVGLLGLLLDRSIIRWFYQNPIKSMLGTYAVGMILRQAVIHTWGPGLQHSSVPVDGTVPLAPGVDIAVWRLIVMTSAFGAAALLAWWLSHSAAGLRIRLTSADSSVAQTLGVNVGTTNAMTFAIGAALAGLAGALVAPLNSVGPDMGVQYLIGAFLVVVLAGLGNVRAAVFWSAAVGILTAAIALPANDVIAQVAVWTIALLVVCLRKRSDVRV